MFYSDWAYILEILISFVIKTSKMLHVFDKPTHNPQYNTERIYA